MSGRPLRVGIVGVGNCASAFAQGLAYHRDAGMDSPGLISVELVLDRGIGGPVIGPSRYYMKSPPRQSTDHEAREQVRLVVDDGRA